MRLLTLTIFLFLSLCSFGHDYFFAHAEVEYNEFSRKFELTITATAHDLEDRLKEKYQHDVKLDNKDVDKQELEMYLNRHFKIRCGKIVSHFRLIGHEVNLNGTVNFYMESDEFTYFSSELNIRFDLLMEKFSEQQNKMTLFFRGKTYSLPFILNEKTKTINLETESK